VRLVAVCTGGNVLGHLPGYVPILKVSIQFCADLLISVILNRPYHADRAALWQVRQYLKALDNNIVLWGNRFVPRSAQQRANSLG